MTLLFDTYIKALTLDEIEHFEKVIKILQFTIDQMEAIDAVWQP